MWYIIRALSMLQPHLVGTSDLQLPVEHWSELKDLITVYTRILPVCQDEQGLTVVLAHGHSFVSLNILLSTDLSLIEIGHVVAHHTTERLSSQTVKLTLLMVSQFLFGLDFLTGNMLARYLLELPNSHTQEIKDDFFNYSPSSHKWWYSIQPI